LAYGAKAICFQPAKQILVFSDETELSMQPAKTSLAYSGETKLSMHSAAYPRSSKKENPDLNEYLR
jgi:hypothetical protein